MVDKVMLGSTAIALTVLSVLLGLLLVLGLVWLLPAFMQRQKAYLKRKTVQKKANEEMVKNIRYRSPSTVGHPQAFSKSYDYGSTQCRQADVPADFPSMNFDVEKNEVPSINITCEEEPVNESPDHADQDQSLSPDVFTDKISLQNSKRRFSSIIFSHSDEIKVMSDGETLEVGGDKRERRASMSLFDTCKLACPDLGENLGHSTEHLNQMILSSNDSQGRLYFMLRQSDSNKGLLEVEVIKVTNLSDRKYKEYQIQMDLKESEENILFSIETTVKLCSGEVVNFDESFSIEVNDKMVTDKSECLCLVFTLVNLDTKKIAKLIRVGEIRFDLMELIEGHVLRLDGQEQFVICRNFLGLTTMVKTKENSGKALIFLRFSKIAPLILVIGVAELKDLRSSKPFSSVNVRISLATEGKVLESRRSKVIKKKYQSVEGVLKVDESFEFNLSLLKMSSKESSKLVFNSSSENVFVTLFLCGRSNIGFSHVLGKCVIGPIEFADGTGLLHWSKGISSLGEIIYHWHNLKN